MGICANDHPYKINGGQEVLIMNLMMLSKEYQPGKMMQGLILCLSFLLIF